MRLTQPTSTAGWPTNVNYIEYYGIVGCHHRNNSSDDTDLIFEFKLNDKYLSSSRKFSVKSGDVLQYSVSVGYFGPFNNGLVNWSINALLSSPSYSDTAGNLIVNGVDTGNTFSSGVVKGATSISATEATSNLRSKFAKDESKLIW